MGLYTNQILRQAKWLKHSGKSRTTVLFLSLCLADAAQTDFIVFCSHFSFEHSKQKEMVVDIQGSGFTYTDPQLHSQDKEYGRADRGNSGFNDFFKTHKCNGICKELCLQHRSTITKRENSK